MKKTVFFGLILLLSAVVCTAGGRGEARNFKVGVMMGDLSDKRQKAIRNGMKDFAAICKDADFIFVDGKGDPVLQITQMNDFIAQAVNAAVIVPIDASVMESAIALSDEAGIPLVGVNRLFDDKFIPLVDAFVGTDPSEAGRLQGKWTVEALGGTGRVGIIKGSMDDKRTGKIVQGIREAFAGTGVKVVLESDGQRSRTRGLEIAENWLGSSSDLDAIICSGNETAIGALLAAQGVGEEVIIVGIDDNPDNLKFLGRGIDAAVTEDYYQQGYSSIEAACRLIKGEPVIQLTVVPYKLNAPEGPQLNK